jgi:RES domain-containing protein
LATQQIEPPTWQLVERLRTFDIAGILVRSFAPGCTEKNQNLVLWQWSALEPNSVRVIDDFGRLPKSTKSWGGQ